MQLLFVNNPVFGCLLGFMLRLFYREIVRDLIFGIHSVFGEGILLDAGSLVWFMEGLL